MSFKIENGALKYYHHAPGETIFDLSIPDSVQKIGSWAFGSHTELTSISIPAGVKEIGCHAFYQCFNLKSFHVAEKNKFFSDLDGILYDKKQYILLHCPNALESVHIPKSVISMKEPDAFAGCHLLKEITVDSRNHRYTVLNGVLYEHDGKKLTKLIRCPVNIHELYIPDSVTEIFPHAFEHCTELEEITIPKQVTEIKAYTFRHCYNLKQVHLHSGIESIGDSAFRHCDSLKEMILPSGIKHIASDVFEGCSHLEKLVIPESVKSVGYMAFGCTKLNSVTCHGIELPVQLSYLNSLIWMIVRKDLKEAGFSVPKLLVLYQMFLKNFDDHKIENYIQENFTQIVTALIQDNQIEAVQNYVKSFRKCLTSQNLDDFIRLAIDEQKYEIQIFLTNLKYQRNDFSPKDWSL